MRHPLFKLNIWKIRTDNKTNNFNYKCFICKKRNSTELIFKLHSEYWSNKQKPVYYFFNVVCSKVCYNTFLLAYADAYTSRW